MHPLLPPLPPAPQEPPEQLGQPLTTVKDLMFATATPPPSSVPRTTIVYSSVLSKSAGKNETDTVPPLKPTGGETFVGALPEKATSTHC